MDNSNKSTDYLKQSDEFADLYRDKLNDANKLSKYNLHKNMVLVQIITKTKPLWRMA